MSFHHNTIHTAIHPSQISTYSSLAGALTPVSSNAQFASPTRRRVPQTACKSVSNPAFAPIPFDYFSQARQGVALRDLNIKSQNAVERLLYGANEPVLANTGIQRMDLRIMWLGYEHLDIHLSFPVTRTITKGQLGAKIATQISKFVEKAETTSATVPAWRIGPDAIRFDQLFLIALYSFGDGVCQADIAVDPHPSHH